MKAHNLLITGILAGCVSCLYADEKPWTPDMSYNVDRRLSASDPIKSPWDFSHKAQDAEYRMLYLLEAHKGAVLVSLSMRNKLGRGDITREELAMLEGTSGNLSEVVLSSYRDVTPYFATERNPALLLMMLYHFEVYCYGGDSNESWPGAIKPLQELDPEITTKAKELAKKGIEDRNKIGQGAEHAGGGKPAASLESKSEGSGKPQPESEGHSR